MQECNCNGVIPLMEAEITNPYQIVSVKSQNLKRLDRLAVLGILPGGEIKIYQKRPSYVIRVGETDIAMDREVIKDIYVERIHCKQQRSAAL